MSVFIRKDSKKGIYSYEFERGGRRFSGSTGKTTRLQAEKFEQARIDEAESQLKENAGLLADELTLEAAAARWMAEVGNNRTDRDRCLTNLAWLLDHFGAHTLLHDIGENRIAMMVAKRRGEYDQRIKHAKPRLVSATTVNRTAIDPLQHVIVRARDTWSVKVARIKWSKFRQKEPQERVREATVAEETALMSQLGRGYDLAIEFLFQTGCRRKEVIGLEWPSVDWFNRRVTVLGKGNKKRPVPLTQRAFEILMEVKDHHPECVFTYEAKYTRRTRHGVSHVKGERYPLTHEGFASAMEAAAKKALLVDFRMHDIRHTTASRVVRASNLKVAQRLLGHSDIRTTMRYVHADDEDVRAALETATPTKSPTVFREEPATRRK